MSRVLVTGGAGYLGSVLVPALLKQRHDVTVLDNFAHRTPSLLPWCHLGQLAIIRGDARQNIEHYISDADVIIPLAAVVGAPACKQDTVAAVSTNARAIEELCFHASDEQIIIYPNSNSGYGTGGATEITEDAALNPLSLYASTKAQAEAAVLTHENGIALRFATLFGCSPRMRLDLLVNDFVHRAVRDRAVTVFEGAFRRNYLHVRDAAETFVFALEHVNEMRGRAFNAGLSKANLSKNDLCIRIQQHIPEFVWNEASVGEDPDKRDYVVSNARLEALGWQPSYSLDDGIIELKKAFSAMPFESFRN